ncbi:amino acid/amide ABC transporter membrane protein 1, HAAT family [Albimonas donghaensis]|uniref:Amino acid/amide ABC transporter membrane protein 1, HAAT family n=1 Tax=Albimonas donghaensis TaxID=356660 RepID=A0A1H3BU19_9RHOB|nr:urea ABC transporter permease subunit UrtB [Albimonas donghaensis]SDX45215.1 amino acid/amide ABC transporter membrane protein 1, HAAT family [Albimonas donghaensis]
MPLLRRLVLLTFAALALAFPATGARADAAEISAIVDRFATASKFPQVEAVIEALGAAGDPLAVPALRALEAGELQVAPDGRVVIERGDALLDPVTLEAAAPVEGRLKKVRTKNSIRRMIGDVISGLTLRAPEPAIRMTAAETIFASADAAQLDALEAALAEETDAGVKSRMEEARAAILLTASDDPAVQMAAIDIIADRGDQQALAVLATYANQASNADVQAAAREGVAEIESTLAMWQAGQNIWYGVSLGSVLFLAAIGLAITFGVMGVINMAHGEMVMLGAYTTFVVQETIRNSFPGAFEFSLLIALPLAFLVSGLVGLVMERGIIRHLYGRPLETLLATWGVSLILQQAVRTIFGPNNREVGNPDWMSGAFMIGEMSVTWSRLWIVVFALCVFGALLFAMNRTPLGLQMRAVTQNRRMASAMGIRTPWVDALTFALGSGIAGIAGVALSQIDNVSPNLGRTYIIDSFMVVVFGGVGNLWGTLVGGLTLGVVNKFLEPYAGAVLGKILILVFIILFIQRRPRGLFALKGRAVE